MKKKILLFVLLVGVINFTQAQNNSEKKVADAVEQLRKAMIDPDSNTLSSLVADELSYGHSGGHIDDKKEFISKLTSGRSDFVTMDLTNQTIHVNKDLAFVRHELTAKTNDGGKPGDV